MKTNKKKGAYLSYALLTFLALGAELLLVTLEQMIHQTEMHLWNAGQTLLHWTLTCIIWGVSSYLILRCSQKELNFSPFDFKDKPETKQWIVIIILSIIFITYMTYNWGMLKPISEFQNKIERYGSFGIIIFIFQNIYYLFESVLMFLIIAFGQEFGEKLFRNKKIPWGGFLLAVTWGLGHILSKDLATGIGGVFSGALLGMIYLLTNKNPKYAYPIITLLFIL